MSRKKKILLCCEASYLNTGYATYGREVMKRLYRTGKYDLAEFASYGESTDPRVGEIPWKFYPNTPQKDSKKEINEYNSKGTNQFGEWKFEQVLLDFQPDIVFDIRDFWMIDYQERSPFRKYFHWAIMPTVDAEPQNEQWLSTYANADGVFNYSEWGRDVLKKEGMGKINCLGCAPPSADAAYSPVSDKREHKKNMGFDPDTMVVGTVMRNQRRKLFPDLFKTFRIFLDSSKRSDIYLYCHTSFPDVGWDIPKLINQYGLSSRIILTYVCIDCKNAFPSYFSDARTRCPFCNGHSAGLASVQKGVSYQFLSDVMNCFDLYLQYANSEGFGLPQVEAAACGVPVMSVDYSAMSSVIRKLDGEPLKVKALYQELETGCNRAVPDNEYSAKKLEEFFNLPEDERLKIGLKVKENFEKYYQWDNTAKVWEDYFDSVEIKPESETWKSPPRIHTPSTSVPHDLPPKEYVQWLILNVLGEPDRLNSYMESRMIRDLNYGFHLEGTGGMYFNEDSMQFARPQFEKFDKEIAYNYLLDLCMRRNFWEQKRQELLI